MPAADSAGSAATSIQEAAEAPNEPADEETPKSEAVTNPGAVAFTDYQPFDLDSIEKETIDSKWKGFVSGMRGISRYSLFDGKLKFRIGGRFQLDGTYGNGNTEFDENYFPIESAVDLRRGSVFAAGRFKQFNFNVAFDFGADWGIDSAWIEGSKGGLEVWGAYLGKLRVGWLNEPFSLERQTGSYNIAFLERSLPVQTIAPGSNIGAMVHNSGPKGRFTWAAGLFSFGQSNDNNASTSALSVTARATMAPVYRDGGRQILHLGLSVSSRSPTGGTIRYRSRPEARFVGYLADTNTIDASAISLIGAEIAGVHGPLWWAAEYIRSKVSAQLVGDPTFDGGYVQVGWILTGESRPYRTNSGTFDRVRPRSKYSAGKLIERGNSGMWEVVGRVSTVDLTDQLVEGGELVDVSASLNWYINGTTRFGLNYIRTLPKDRGAANIVLLRFQFQPW
jgi:phosphate-selective porin OprO/OprP